MATTIPNLPASTYRLDTLFNTTWFEMRDTAIDQIEQSNVFSAWLKSKGCYQTQRGGRHIARELLYGTKTAIAIQKGDTLPTGEDDIETMALWNWKYLAVRVQRSLQDDQQNTGPAMRKSLVQTKLNAAYKALEQKFEDSLLAKPDQTTAAIVIAGARAPKDPHSIQNALPIFTASSGGYPTTGTFCGTTGAGVYLYGGVDTYNDWWRPRAVTVTQNRLANMVSDMRTLYNYCSGGGNDTPDGVLMGQTDFEAYEDVCQGQIQLVQDVGSDLAKLGYKTLKFKGADVIWSPNTAISSDSTYGGNNIRMLNSKWLEIVKDPGLWMTITPWDYLPNQLERVCTIVCAFPGVICTQLRRQGSMTSYTS